MGVGDYVHSKENRQHHHRADVPTNQTRKKLAEQARVEVPQTALVAPIPISTNRQAPIDRYGTPFQDNGPAEQLAHRDAFDTDVEGIDESTIAATSVVGIDEEPCRLSPTIRPNVNVPVQLPPPQPSPRPSPSPPRQLRAARRANESKWYEGLGDRALKSAGFDLDDLDAASQLTSTAGDDEQSNDTDDQRHVPRYRGSEEPFNRKLQNFWSASRRTYQSDAEEHTEPTKPQSLIPVASASKPLPASGRKVTLTRSKTTTPRTRFSPPKPSLLDQLDLTPTRRSPNLTRSHSRKERERDSDREREKENNKAADDFLRVADEGLGLFTDDNNTHPDDSLQSLNVFDMTNFDDLENDSSMNDPFSRRNSVRRIGTEETPKARKRNLEPDYPPEILCTKSFSELQAEPFDHAPTPRASRPAKETQAQHSPEKGNEEDKVSFLLRLSEQERREYFSKLSVNEWEGCGDLLIEEFSKMMVKMKDLRHARRKTAAVFEAEVRRRHEMVEEQSTEITGKFEEMRAGGAEVLRGRSP